MRTSLLGRACGLATFLSLASWLQPAAPAHGQTAYLVRDLAEGTSSRDASWKPHQLLPAAGRLFFTADLDPVEPQVWVSDGTASGTELLADVRAGTCWPPRGPVLLGSARGVVFWAAREDRGCSVSQLWRSDGTRAGTFPLTDPGLDLGLNDGEEERGFALLGGLLYFVARNGSQGHQLWQSDGTFDGTRLVHGDPDRFGFPRFLTVVGSRLFLVADDEGGTPSLWVSDGTAGGTVALREFPANGYAPYLLTAAGGRLFFAAQGVDGVELWTSDGTASGTRPLTRFSAPFPFPEEIPWLAPTGSRVVFVADDGIQGAELWRSDGTAAGTVRITELAEAAPFPGSFQPDQLAEVKGRVVFPATDGSKLQLWSTNGSPASTAALLEIGGPPSRLLGLGGRALFAAEEADHGREVWSTDGTVRGTALLRDLCPGPCSSLEDDADLLPLAGSIFFVATARSFDRPELWRTDGTAGGTRRIAAGLELASPQIELALVGGRLFFSAEDDQGGGLWVSDGTPGGARRVADFQQEGAGADPAELLALQDRVVFTACSHSSLGVWQSAGTFDTTRAMTEPRDSCAAGRPGPRGLAVAGGSVFFWSAEDPLELWAVDLSGGGSRLLTSFSSDLPSDEHPGLLALGGRVYFVLHFEDDDASRTEVWRSDGTVAGTHEAFELPDEAGSIRSLGLAGGRLYIVTVPSDGGEHQLWTSDGTQTGTHLVLAGGPSFLQPPQFIRAGSHVYFLALFDESLELWKTDGTAAGTLRVGELDPFFDFEGQLPELLEHQGLLYAFADATLWRSDGTAAGTILLKQLRLGALDERPPAGLTSFGSRLFFVADDGEHGFELWQSDGTAAGTTLVRDIAAGPAGSEPAGLRVADGRLFFAATDRAHGRELWQSDGTEAGTRLAQDLAPGAVSSLPGEITATGSHLFFAADDGLSGRELWALPLTSPSACPPSPGHLCLSSGRFRVEAAWRDSRGFHHAATAMALTGDTGYFWFFHPSNVEVVVKLLDGRGQNGHFWVFYGALSNVEYTLTVTDTQTGLTRRYLNPRGILASVGDTHGFGPLGAFGPQPPARAAAGLSPRIQEKAAVATGPCEPRPARLCLNGGRFAVEAVWKDFAGRTGAATAVGLTSDTGYFWFFGPDNVEVVLKVLDGRGMNGRFWVFFGALSNVEYTLTVTDTATGQVKTYTNPSGRFASVADTAAF